MSDKEEGISIVKSRLDNHLGIFRYFRYAQNASSSSASELITMRNNFVASNLPFKLWATSYKKVVDRIVKKLLLEPPFLDAYVIRRPRFPKRITKNFVQLTIQKKKIYTI